MRAVRWLVVRSSLIKLFPKEKNRKKRKPFNQGGQAEKPKGNGISPEGWQGNTVTRRRKPPYLPCHYAVVFWWGGAVAVRFSFATFFILFCVHFSNIPFIKIKKCL
ncbi:MAG TPA: hypothetical protein DCQ68_17970 [Chryseobacterium indologenes]|nr:hypothetical protein [Chryseobacterium indologenes]